MQRILNVLNRRPVDKIPETGFHTLAEELVQEILQYLHWPTDFYNLSLVSRALNRLAIHKLYSILVIGYHRPERISALLTYLQMRPDLGLLVRTVIFDEDVKCIGPKLLQPEKWPPRAHRRELTDGWNPSSPGLRSPRSYPYNRHHKSISYKLKDVLDGLPNVRRVLMRNVHPLYMHFGVPEKNTNATNAITEWNALSEMQSSSNGSIWTRLSTRSPLITEVFVNGITDQMPPKVMLSRLTTICISDLYHSLHRHSVEAYSWNALLAHAPSIKSLGMVCVEYAHIILLGCIFPHLEALELYKVFLCGPLESESPVLLQFLHQHSSTLRTLALSTHLCWSVNHCRWLSDKTSLPRLQTLRLDNVYALLGTESTTDDGLDLDVAEVTRIIIAFIAHRPTIIDVGISSLEISEADAFAKYLAETRPMRNIFIGSVVVRSLNTFTCITRLWKYSYDAWTFYHLFGGLTITRSGFRPSLPPQGWKFWKKNSQ